MFELNDSKLHPNLIKSSKKFEHSTRVFSLVRDDFRIRISKDLTCGKMEEIRWKNFHGSNSGNNNFRCLTFGRVTSSGSSVSEFNSASAVTSEWWPEYLGNKDKLDNSSQCRINSLSRPVDVVHFSRWREWIFFPCFSKNRKTLWARSFFKRITKLKWQRVLSYKSDSMSPRCMKKSDQTNFSSLQKRAELHRLYSRLHINRTFFRSGSLR